MRVYSRPKLLLRPRLEVAGNGHFLYNGRRHSHPIGARAGCLGGQLFEMEVLCQHVTETRLALGGYGSRK